MRSNRPILVTGSNRSGSTWIGKTISHAPYIRYIHEPFNVAIAERIYGEKLERWFHLVTDNDNDKFEKYLKRVLYIPDNSIKEILLSGNKRELRSNISKTVRYYLPYILGVRPLVKDPIAIFSADWLVNEFDMDALVIIRHPAAYVWSVIKDPIHMHSFESVFKNQPLLLEKLPLLKSEILAVDETLELYKRAAIFWKAIHSIIAIYRVCHPDWIFYRYEDIASQPLSEFKNLCKKLNIEFTQKVDSVVRRYAMCDSRVLEDLTSHVKKFRSDKYIKDWKNHLDNEQITVIREITEPIASKFYTDEDW